MSNETDTKNADAKTQNTEPNQQDNQPKNFEEWLEGQDDGIQKLYDEHVKGLKNTISATRQERDAFKKEVEVALKKAEKGSELEKNLSDTLTKLEIAEKAKRHFWRKPLRPENRLQESESCDIALAVED